MAGPRSVCLGCHSSGGSFSASQATTAAMAAGLLVLSTHVPLGQVVLQRGIIFIDLAIAQVAALGVIAADSLGWEENTYAVQIAAVSAALLAAAGLHWSERHWPDTLPWRGRSLFFNDPEGRPLAIMSVVEPAAT